MSSGAVVTARGAGIVAPAEGIDYRGLATCVAGGLAISTFFTLWVVPLAFTLLDDLGRVLSERTHSALLRLARLRMPSQGAPGA